MNTTPASGDQLPDDPHLAEDIGVTETPTQEAEDEAMPTGMTNAGQQVSGVRDVGTREPGAGDDEQGPAAG